MEVGYDCPLPFPGGRLRIRTLIAYVLLGAVASGSQSNQVPTAIGGFGVVATERQNYTWLDSLSRDSDATYGYRLDSYGYHLDMDHPVIYSLQQANLCLHGYFKSTDYIRDYFTDCVMMTDSIVRYFRFWDTSFFYFSNQRMIAGVQSDGQPSYIGYEMSRDTLSLSTIWVRLGDKISILMPGYWPMDTIAYFCRRAIARDPVLKTRTREDWNRDYEGSRITRFTWTLLPLPDAIAGSRRQTAFPPLAPGMVDARGRRLSLQSFPQPGIILPVPR